MGTVALSLCPRDMPQQTQHLGEHPELQLPLQPCAESSETGESRMGSTGQRNATETAGKHFTAKSPRGAGAGRARGAVPCGHSRCPLAGQWFCHSQVAGGVGAALLLPPVDDDDGDGHADDEHGGDDASHDPNDPSRGTLR